MGTTARLPIVADRAGACVRTVSFRGLDLTGIAQTLEVRLGPDTPGAPQIALGIVANNSTEGLFLLSVEVDALGVKTSNMQIFIAEATIKDPTKLPYMGEIGSPSTLGYGWVFTINGIKRQLVAGDLILLPTVPGADNAPADRPAAFGYSGSAASPWISASLTFDDATTEIVLNGIDLIEPLVQSALSASSAAQTAAAQALAQGLPTEFHNGTFDPDLAGPSYDYGTGAALAPEPSDAPFANIGLPRMVDVPGQFGDVYLNLDPLSMVPVGGWVAIAIALRIGDASQWADLEGRVRIVLNAVGQDANAQELVAFVDYDVIDASHRVYRAVLENPFTVDLNRVSIRFTMENATYPVHFAAQSIATSAVQPSGVNWRVTDPFGIAVLASKLPGGGPIVVFGDSLAYDFWRVLSTYVKRQIVLLAVGGQTSTQAVNRLLGGTMAMQNAQIVAGNNTVTALNGIPIADTLDANGNPTVDQTGGAPHRVLQGVTVGDGLAITAGSITGMLYPATSGSNADPYTFVPDAGQGLPVRFPDGSTWRTTLPARPTVIGCIGRNNIFTTLGTALQGFGPGVVMADVARAQTRFPDLILLTIPNGDLGAAEYGPAGNYYLNLQDINGRFATALGNHLIDNVRVKKDRGLALSGLQPNAQDASDAANDLISNQLRRDGLHGNAAAWAIDATLGAAKLLELGL